MRQDNLFAGDAKRQTVRSLILTRKFLKAGEISARRRTLPATPKGGEYRMSEDERKRRIDEIRREVRVNYQIHQEMMELANRINKRFEPDHDHPEKTLW